MDELTGYIREGCTEGGGKKQSSFGVAVQHLVKETLKYPLQNIIMSLNSMSRLASIFKTRKDFSKILRNYSTTVKSLLSKESSLSLGGGREVCVTGWFKSIREQKNYSFGELIDGSTALSLQLVWPTTMTATTSSTSTSSAGTLSDRITSSLPQYPTTLSLKPSLGSSVKVWGTLIASPKPNQPVEVQVSRYELLGNNDAVNYPLQRKAKESSEFLREILHLRARSPLISAAMRVRESMSYSISSLMRKQGVLHVHTPILTSNDCEGGGELFSVLPASSHVKNGTVDDESKLSSFFGKPVYLTVSGQLHLEALAVGGALSRVYSLGPTFRAEDSNTPRHLCEFWMLEAEIAPGSMQEAMDLAEHCLRQTCRDLLAERPDDINVLISSNNVNSNNGSLIRDRLEASALHMPAGERFPQITYTEALTILNKSITSFKVPVPVWGDGLALEHERFLTDKHFKGPVFVTHYPAKCKPFYMRTTRNADTGVVENNVSKERETVEAFDFLVPGVGELAGGSAREDNFGLLAAKMQKLNLLSPEYSKALAASNGQLSSSLPMAQTDSRFLDWYLDLRRFGGSPSSGFGLGFERLVMFATGIENVRDAIPMPRTPNSCRM
jgi:asparaginyl-tRNA synthetase